MACSLTIIKLGNIDVKFLSRGQPLDSNLKPSGGLSASLTTKPPLYISILTLYRESLELIPNNIHFTAILGISLKHVVVKKKKKHLNVFSTS